MRNGNLPAEQIRNRLIERKKYLLPTSTSGLIIENKLQLLLEAKKKISHSEFIQFHHKGEKWPKKLIFKNFELLNKVPNNFCALSDGSIIVCSDFFLDSDGSPQISGRKFLDLNDAFVKPYRSSTFGIYVGWNISTLTEFWPASQVAAKMYAFPRRPSISVSLNDVNQQWFLIPIRHTIIRNLSQH